MSLPCAECRGPSSSKCDHCALPYCSDDCLNTSHEREDFECFVYDRAAMRIGGGGRTEVIIEFAGVQIAIQELIGEGAWGKVYAACMNADCDTVVKLQALSSLGTTNLETPGGFNEEIYISNVASDKNFGPKLFFGAVFEKHTVPQPITKSETFNRWLMTLRSAANLIGVIVQQRWSMSLDKFDTMYWQDMDVLKSVQNLDTLQRLIMYKTSTMWAYGFVHGDLLMKNVLINVDEDNMIMDVILADFGLSFPIKQAHAGTIKQLVNYFSAPGQLEHAAFNAPRLENFTDAAVIEFPLLLDYVLADYFVAVRSRQA